MNHSEPEPLASQRRTLEQRGVRSLLIWPSDPADLFPVDTLRAMSSHVSVTTTLDEALTACGLVNPELVIFPIALNGQSLLPYMENCRVKLPGVAMIVIAGNDQINEAAEAMRNGAKDCLFRPFSAARLERTIRAVLGDRIGTASPLSKDKLATGSLPAPKPKPVFHGMIGASRVMDSVFSRVTSIAPSKAPVMIRGDVGTGKSMLARVIHDASGAAGQFVAFENACSEAKTPVARMTAHDIFERLTQARGGTLFLDRLDEMDIALQAQLLPAVQHHIGQGAASDIRFIAALTAPPVDAIAAGRLRSDLFYWLNVVEIGLPPLRLRDKDLIHIAQAKLPHIAVEEGRGIPNLSDQVLDALSNYSWPGNVRELLATLRGLVLTGSGQHVHLSDLPARVLLAQPPHLRPAVEDGPDTKPATNNTGIGPLVGKRLQDIERAVIEATIATEGGSIPRAAKVLDVSPSTIYRKREGWMDRN